MERLIRHGNIINDPLYNCSARTPEMINKWYTEPAPVHGIICFTMGIINQILYLLCVKVMLEPTNIVYTAYKIMVVIAICDMIGVVCNCWVFGVMFYYGVSFCDAPNIIYTTGSIGTGAWTTGSLSNSLLIINRLVELRSSQNKVLMNIFNGKYTFVPITLTIIAGIYYLIHEPSLILNPKSGLAYWDPQIFKNASSLYAGPVIVFVDTIVVSFNLILSVILCFNISKHLSENFGSIIDQRRQSALFFQCLALVSLCNVGSMFYLSTFFFECPPLYKKIAGFLYQLYTSIPPYIFLFLNRTIRNGILKLFMKYKSEINFSTSFKSSTLSKENPISSIFSSSIISNRIGTT